MLKFKELPLVDFANLRKKPGKDGIDHTDTRQSGVDEERVEIDVSNYNIAAAEDHLYSYEFLLKRAKDQISEKNPSLVTNKGYSYPVPKLGKKGPKIIVYTNIEKTAASLNREIVHIQTFIESELQTTAPLNGEKQLQIKGRFDQNKISSVIEKYIEEYVKCCTCGRTNTNIKREKNSKFFMLTCNDCNSSKTITNIKKKN